MVTTCCVCNRELSTRTPGVYEEVKGYVSTNGAKGFRTGEHLGRFFHEKCLNDQRSGVNRNQEALAL